MDSNEAIIRLNGLETKTKGPGEVHCSADAILLAFVRSFAPEVATAFDAVVDRSNEWWYE